MNSLHGKRVVIFGCGYVGTAVAQAALAAGARVEALTRNPEKAAALKGLGLTKVALAELSSADWHREIDGGAEAVVNCVSSAGGPGGYQQSYVAGMKSILAWAAVGRAPVGTIIYTSSTSVYPHGGGAVVDETAPADGATPNGRIIRESERMLENASAAACHRWFILRLAGIYGPGRHHLLDQLRTDAATLGGDGSYRLNLAHRDDIVAAILGCMSAPAAVRNEIFNVVDTAPAGRAEVVRWLAGRLGRGVPGFDGFPGVRRSGEPMPDRIISSSKIARVLGWRPQYPDYRAGYENLLSP
jgi:nucleoside-diphosphate-sugar epimerase